MVKCYSSVIFWKRTNIISTANRSANGINKGIIRALKITAERIAVSGECKFIIFKCPNVGIEAMNNAGNVQQLIISNTEKPLAGLAGPDYVNVLKLNMALDSLK